MSKAAAVCIPRHPSPAKTLTSLFTRHIRRLEMAAYGDAVRQKSNDRVTTATTTAMELLDLHFTDKAIQIIRGTKA